MSEPAPYQAYDHHIIDGTMAEAFLQFYTNAIESIDLDESI